MTLQTSTLSFTEGGTTFHAHLAFDDAIAGPRPGVLICPDASGLGPEAERRAALLAELGYAALAIDYYGGGLQPTSDVLMQHVGPLREDVNLLRRRALAGLALLRSQPQVDAARTAAIGYCFGGTMAIELARARAELLGVVSFHGGLTAGQADEVKQMQAGVLVLTGADDPLVPPEAVSAFITEMRAATSDWQLVSYSGTAHAFTRPDVNARSNGNPAFAYNASSDRRSWAAMRGFFDELFNR